MSTEFDHTMRSLLDPKSSQGGYTLPCGYLSPEGALYRKIEIREMTGAEEDILASKNTKAADKMHMIMSRCVTRMEDESDPAKIAHMVESLPVGDRLFLLMAIRQVTLGDEYFFRAKCPNDQCAKESVYGVLLSELEVKQSPDPMKRIFDTILPKSQIPVRFRLLTGRDEATIGTKAGSADALSLAMLIRIELFNGKPPTLGDIKGIGLKDRQFMRSMFDGVDGGIDTETEMTCSHCGTEFKKDVDVAQSGFFFPQEISQS